MTVPGSMLRGEVHVNSISPSRASSPPAVSAAALLGLSAGTPDELALAIARGLPTSAPTRLAKHLQLQRNALIHLLESPTGDSASRNASTSRARLSPTQSQRLYDLALVLEAAGSYFEDIDAARRWVVSPRSTFGGFSPLEYAGRPGGAEYVRKVLYRLEHGVHA